MDSRLRKDVIRSIQSRQWIRVQVRVKSDTKHVCFNLYMGRQSVSGGPPRAAAVGGGWASLLRLLLFCSSNAGREETNCSEFDIQQAS